MNYSRYINSLSAARKSSPIREMTNLLTQGSPDLVFLAGGLPNPNTFPFQSASIKLRDGSNIQLEGKTINDALQYGPTQGYGPLLSQLKEMQQKLHSPPCWADTEVVITSGSQDGLCKAFEMMLNVNDHVIIQEPVYAGTLAIVNPFKPKYIPVQCDANGLIPDLLRKCLETNWKSEDAQSPTSDIPKVLYVNPAGANPTGVSIPLDRRQEIYQIAKDYDLIILEDDPYYFLQFDKKRTPSFLSIDTDGRVVRFDSLSKVLSSGIRLGYVTGPRPLMERILYHMQVSVIHASSMSQVLVSELLKQWGVEGFMGHVDRVQNFYLQQREVMLKAAETHLTGLAEWNVPQGGMFLWIKCLGISDTRPMIMERALKKDVILLPGREFMTDPSQPCPYMRASFSLPTPENIDRGFRNLSELIREEIELTKKN
ncbi:kynurenine/alpha-aminoadipate aminotransferase, mitochondrial-like [Daphnia pulicaria]|uniref:kynurenine/alpha-aminoadipate aminotransferase, mitochondrial-like n=1 Tax=Daphnia pulicaria TaxID=35523 RepID=UPI001EEAA186|nr:kynurenine/alpha-aminoadipate aminotransferase, mitochondrial-like [Daphnia pulicaria]